MSDRRIEPISASSRRLSLDSLVPRRDRSRKLSPRVAKALRSHMEHAGWCPPLVVRPKGSGRYEIIDGAARAAMLGQLGRTSARCEVVSADDAQAQVLAATLDELRGRCAPRVKARRIADLARECGEAKAAEMLGMTPPSVSRQIDMLASKPGVVEPAEVLDMQPLVFHLPGKAAAEVRRVLRDHGSAKLGRGRALAKALGIDE